MARTPQEDDAATASSHKLGEHTLMRSNSSRSRSTEPRLEWHCRVCGYGIVVAGPPPECPMCRSDDWFHDSRRGDSDALARVLRGDRLERVGIKARREIEKERRR